MDKVSYRKQSEKEFVTEKKFRSRSVLKFTKVVARIWEKLDENLFER
jgi:hypothetical protein